MPQFFLTAKKTFIFLFKHLWFVALLLVGFNLIYQNSFSWSNKDLKAASQELKNNENVIFLVVEDKFSSAKANSFASLSNSLKTWEFDKKKQKMYVKYEKLLPYYYSGEGSKKEIIYDKTKVMVLYDRGFDSFERYSEVLSVATFPYEYYFKGNPLVSINGIDKDGTVFIEYKGKRLKLGPNNDYSSHSISGFQLSKTVIKNYGIYQKNQFLPMEKPKKEKENEKPLKEKSKDENIETKEKEDEKKELNNIHE